MKVLILMFTTATLFAQATSGQNSTGTRAAPQRPSVRSTAETAPKPELFRDPFRKVKNANGELVNADLRPLFAWFQNRRGERPMKTWGRNVAMVIENKPGGVLVSNYTDKKTFFLRNYPYNVPANMEIHIFSVDSGFYTYKDSSGAEQTVHASDYGIPFNPAKEKKASSASPAKQSNAAAAATGK